MRLPKLRFTIGFLLIVVAVSAVVLWLLEPKINTPKSKLVIIGTLTVDRGTLLNDVYRRQVWILRNEGRTPLVLAITSCSPGTGVSLWNGDNLVLMPGEEGELKFTFETPFKVGERFSKTADFSTNDPDAPRFVLQVNGITGTSESPESPTGQVPLRTKP